ncbi:MAG: hypothetical protein Q9219_004933 [cf. Caloplaca sp. 3 TL-2023]
MSTDYTYDEQNTAPRIKSDFKPLDENLIQGQKRKQWRRERRLKRFITVVAGYATMALMLYLIAVTKTTVSKIYDPYDILDIPRVGLLRNTSILVLTVNQSADEKKINKRYRDLSRVYHPDKARPDESKNQTIEDINEYWVELSKAYKALTDEEIRNNYIQFGHPDGKQSFSIGIALPKFIIAEGNGKYVLLVYGLLLGVLLPYVVGKWWYGTQKKTKEKVLLASAGNLFREYTENLTDGGVVNALTSGEEYKDVLSGHKAELGLGKVEKLVSESPNFDQGTTGLVPLDQQTLEGSDGVRRKILALLWAYLGRVQLDGSTLDDEKYEIAPLALALNESFTAISLAYGNVAQILMAYHASQNLIQAIPPNASPLLQLPYITPAIAHAIEGPNARSQLTIQEFMSLPEYKRRKLATDQPNALSPSQYNTAVSVARQLPLLVLEKVFFKVTGEKVITTGSLVQMVIKARVIPPGSANVPAVEESDLEDIDPDEGDIDVLLGRKSTKSTEAKVPDNSNDANKLSTAPDKNQQPLQPPLAFAPYFPRDHSPRWHVFLADSRLGRMAVPPFTFTTFSKPLFDEKTGGPTFNVQTFKCQFQAPPQVGKYPFVMHLVCDSYVGMDSKVDVVLEVEDASKGVDIVEEDEISEPDEAGQMSALKSGGLSGGNQSRRKKRIQQEEVGSSDDESDTEGDAGSDTSETNTDTDTDE